jgi:hypothetical protein
VRERLAFWIANYSKRRVPRGNPQAVFLCIGGPAQPVDEVRRVNRKLKMPQNLGMRLLAVWLILSAS